MLGRFNISSEKYAKYANCLLNLRSLWFLANTYFSQKSPGEYIFLQENEVSNQSKLLLKSLLIIYPTNIFLPNPLHSLFKNVSSSSSALSISDTVFITAISSPRPNANLVSDFLVLISLRFDLPIVSVSHCCLLW